MIGQLPVPKKKRIICERKEPMSKTILCCLRSRAQNTVCKRVIRYGRLPAVITGRQHDATSDDPSKYEKGTQDENYYCEIWIPVKKK